jgi:chromate reductase
MRVLGISGSLRRDSYNTALLRHVGELLEAEGAQFEIYDGLRDIPPFDEDEEPFPAEAVSRLRQAIENADAVFFATPEYNSSIPGVLKNALDWVSRPFATNAMRNKPVAVVGASAGMFGAVWAQAELRKVLSTMGARVAEGGEVAVGHAEGRFDEAGTLTDLNLADDVREVALMLIAEAQPTRVEQLAA